jgi:DNA-binding NarL/FixJ family response regulator
MQIASLIKEGRASEEIAKKLGLKTETGERINLVIYLVSHW